MKLKNPRRERILTRFIEEEMRESFIDYSMSVIVQRALPDARDGLKPVQRRILFAMHELGLAPGRPHKKSATVVGDVLGKYHPHGDVAVYDTLVRLAQDFSMRYPLVDGQGNFGSLDGDPAAAYRYTEARLAPIAGDLLRDIEKDTVDFKPNFDGRLEEPAVLPTGFPQLLVSGSDGIAVGMATKIPPHNLREIAEATIRLLIRPNTSTRKLLEIVRGPDFPTGGIIWGREAIEEAQLTGRGRIIVRARAHIEQGGRGKLALVVTEIPYQVSKQRLIESIAGLVRKGQVDGVTDLRDESDRDGVRLVIELKRDAQPRKILEKLFRKTQLQTTFGVICLALVNGIPGQLDLKQSLEVWIEHRLAVIVRRTSFNLERAEQREHILEGLLIAIGSIDEVVEIIRSSRNPETAARNLRSALKITGEQATAILAMRLSQLTNLESRKLREELGAVQKRIRTLQAILADEKKRRDLIRRELTAIAERYGDARRTEILDDSVRFPIPSGAAEQEIQILHTYKGFVKAMPARGRQLDAAAAAAEGMQSSGDLVNRVWLCKSDDQLLVFSSGGQVHSIRAGDLPQGSRSGRGRRLSEELGIGEEIVATHPVRQFSADRFLVFTTRGGRVKRTQLSEYANIRSSGINACGVEKGDALIDVHLSDGAGQLVLCTASGQAIRFDESEVRAMGRAASGVKGIELEKGDALVSFVMPRPNARLLALTASGRMALGGPDSLRRQARGGKGRALIKGGDRKDRAIGLLDLLPNDGVAGITGSDEVISIDLSEQEGAKRPRLELGGRRLAAVTHAAFGGVGARVGEEEAQMSFQI